ncbi:hypothetical protein BJ741DRAFT_166016 [Chytriomyces cf. hyalinus JEL632]|nr:hypothetical protein BJ741DRAFT_166016 [Chytriomyces cf. hyalinus JEL632]
MRVLTRRKEVELKINFEPKKASPLLPSARTMKKWFKSLGGVSAKENAAATEKIGESAARSERASRESARSDEKERERARGRERTRTAATAGMNSHPSTDAHPISDNHLSTPAATATTRTRSRSAARLRSFISSLRSPRASLDGHNSPANKDASSESIHSNQSVQSIQPTSSVSRSRSSPQSHSPHSLPQSVPAEEEVLANAATPPSVTGSIFSAAVSTDDDHISSVPGPQASPVQMFTFNPPPSPVEGVSLHRSLPLPIRQPMSTTPDNDTDNYSKPINPVQLRRSSMPASIGRSPLTITETTASAGGSVLSGFVSVIRRTSVSIAAGSVESLKLLRQLSSSPSTVAKELSNPQSTSDTNNLATDSTIPVINLTDAPFKYADEDADDIQRSSRNPSALPDDETLVDHHPNSKSVSPTTTTSTFENQDSKALERIASLEASLNQHAIDGHSLQSRVSGNDFDDDRFTGKPAMNDAAIVVEEVALVNGSGGEVQSEEVAVGLKAHGLLDTDGAVGAEVLLSSKDKEAIQHNANNQTESLSFANEESKASSDLKAGTPDSFVVLEEVPSSETSFPDAAVRSSAVTEEPVSTILAITPGVPDDLFEVEAKIPAVDIIPVALSLETIIVSSGISSEQDFEQEGLVTRAFEEESHQQSLTSIISSTGVQAAAAPLLETVKDSLAEEKVPAEALSLELAPVESLVSAPKTPSPPPSPQRSTSSARSSLLDSLLPAQLRSLSADLIENDLLSTIADDLTDESASEDEEEDSAGEFRDKSYVQVTGFATTAGGRHSGGIADEDDDGSGSTASSASIVDDLFEAVGAGVEDDDAVVVLDTDESLVLQGNQDQLTPIDDALETESEIVGKAKESVQGQLIAATDDFVENDSKISFPGSTESVMEGAIASYNGESETSKTEEKDLSANGDFGADFSAPPTASSVETLSSIKTNNDQVSKTLDALKSRLTFRSFVHPSEKERLADQALESARPIFFPIVSSGSIDTVRSSVGSIKDLQKSKSFTRQEFHSVTECCRLPRHLTYALHKKICAMNQVHDTIPSNDLSQISQVTWVQFEAFVEGLYRRFYPDVEALTFEILRTQTNGDRILVPEDFRVFVEDVLENNSAFAFLASSPDFQLRFTETVIVRLFYSNHFHGRNRMSLRDFRTAHVYKVIAEIEAATNSLSLSIPAPFCYKDFYVIYCAFWELDKDHDMYLTLHDLERYSDRGVSHAALARVVECYGRVPDVSAKKPTPASASASPTSPSAPELVQESSTIELLAQNRIKCFGFQEFVAFIMAVEDKTSVSGLYYWFRVLDIDEDGLVSLLEIETFWEHQYTKVPEQYTVFDFFSLILDLIRPDASSISLLDLKRNAVAAGLFLDFLLDSRRHVENIRRSADVSYRLNDEVWILEDVGSVKSPSQDDGEEDSPVDEAGALSKRIKLEGWQKFVERRYRLLSGAVTEEEEVDSE